MNRNTSDISSLYRQFGGDPGQYREIGLANKAGVARERWPLLGHVQPGTRFVPPKVGSSTADRPVVQASWPPLAVSPTTSLLFPEQSAVDPVRTGAVASAEAVVALIHSTRVERQPLDALTVPLAVEEDATASEDPVGDIEFAPAVPAATPATAAPVAQAFIATAQERQPHVEPRLEPGLEPGLAPVHTREPMRLAEPLHAVEPLPAAAKGVAPVAATARIAEPTPAAKAVKAAAPPTAAPAYAPAAAPAYTSAHTPATTPRKPTAPPLALVHPAPAAAPVPTTSLQGVFKRLAQAPRSEANPEQSSPPRKTTQK
ncbi:cellulose biosynthesis protein BcsP [Bordetella sp. LUAb4]|uniref:cellulose biosynthesis protein BcsP n=1 Tax=Bordetella sp. LUAb4 TaxID=2843195 RepID=UPI001E2AB690